MQHIFCSKCMEKGLKKGKEITRPSMIIHKGNSLCLDCFRSAVLITGASKRGK